MNAINCVNDKSITDHRESVLEFLADCRREKAEGRMSVGTRQVFLPEGKPRKLRFLRPLDKGFIAGVHWDAERRKYIECSQRNSGGCVYCASGESVFERVGFPVIDYRKFHRLSKKERWTECLGDTCELCKTGYPPYYSGPSYLLLGAKEVFALFVVDDHLRKQCMTCQKEIVSLMCCPQCHQTRLAGGDQEKYICLRCRKEIPLSCKVQQCGCQDQVQRISGSMYDKDLILLRIKDGNYTSLSIDSSLPFSGIPEEYRQWATPIDFNTIFRVNLLHAVSGVTYDGGCHA